MARVLALDVGTSSARAAVFEADAAEGDHAGRDYPDENDPETIVALVREVVDEAQRGEEVDAAGVSCFGHSLLALDARGRALTPVLGWRDTRSADAVDRLERRLDGSAVHARTGCPLHTSFWPAKLAWLAEREPEIFRSARRFVSFAEYLYRRLFDETDVPVSLSLASGTGLLDLHRQTWDAELLSTLGIDETVLPGISDEPLHGWFPALIDGACSNLGVGCVTPERAALMIGTSGAFRTLYGTDAPQPRPGLFMYRLDTQRVVEGGSLSDGGNLYRWIGDTFRESEGSLADRDPDSHGLTFVTLLGGERSPGWHSRARGAIAGFTFETTPLDLRQAALEGVAFRFAEIAGLMPEVEEVVATGGALLKDEDWLQIVADALGRPITASSVREASLRGAAVATLGRLGESPTQAPPGRLVMPRRDRVAAYQAARERQRALYRAATGTATS